MGLMDAFRSTMGNRGTAQQPQQGQQPNQQMGQVQGQQQPQGQQQVQPSAQPGGLNNPGNLQVPNAAPGQSGQQAQRDNNIPKNLDKASLDDFNSLWDKPKDGKDQSQAGRWQRPKLDSNKITETVNRMSFTAGVDPQLATKALSGDVESFFAVLDQVGRNGFQTSFGAMDNYQGRMFDAYDQSVNSRIPRMVSSLGSQRQIGQLNRNLQHPALAPMVDTIRQQFESRYPDASPDEIAEAVNAYFQQAAGVLTTGQGESGNGTTAGSQVMGQQNPGRGQTIVTDFDGFELDPMEDQRNRRNNFG